MSVIAASLEHFVAVPAEDLRRGMAQQVFCGAVPQKDTAVRVHGHRCVGRVVKEGQRR